MPNADTAAVRASSSVLTNDHQPSLRGGLPPAMTMRAAFVFYASRRDSSSFALRERHRKKTVRASCSLRNSFVRTFRAKFSVVFSKWHHVLLSLKESSSAQRRTSLKHADTSPYNMPRCARLTYPLIGFRCSMIRSKRYFTKMDGKNTHTHTPTIYNCVCDANVAAKMTMKAGCILCLRGCSYVPSMII